MADLGPSRNGQKRPLQGEDAATGDDEQSKRRKLTDLVGSRPRAKRCDGGPAQRLVPPNWGSELYTWLAEQDDGLRDTEEPEESSEEIERRDFQPRVLRATSISRQGARDGGPSAAATLDIGCAEAGGLRLNIPSNSCSDSPLSSVVNDPITPLTDTGGTLTTGCKDHGSERAESSLDNQGLSHRSHREKGLQPRTLNPSITGCRQEVKQTSSRHPVVPYTDSSGKLKGLPESWDQAYPADKMIICMKEEGHSWRAIVRKWHKMTGDHSTPGNLRARYIRLKRKLGLMTDDDMERVLIIEATARSKSNGQGMDIAGSEAEGNSSDGATPPRVRRTKHSRRVSANPTRPAISFPNLLPYPPASPRPSDDIMTEGPRSRLPGSEPRIQTRKSFSGFKSHPLWPDSVSDGRRTILERKDGSEVEAEASGSEGHRSCGLGMIRENDTFVCNAKRRVLGAELSHLSGDIGMVDGGDEGIGGPGCFEVLSASKTTTAVEDLQYPHQLSPETRKPRSEFQDSYPAKASRWMKFKLPRGMSLEISSPNGTPHNIPTRTLDTVKQTTELCAEREHEWPGTRQPARENKLKLQLTQPARIRNIKLHVGPLGPAECASDPARTTASRMSQGIPAVCQPKGKEVSSEVAYEASTRIDEDAALDGTNETEDGGLGRSTSTSEISLKEQMRRRKLSIAKRATWARRRAESRSERHSVTKKGDGSREEKRRRNISIAVTASWARRRAEGTNGVHGGLPMVATIKRRQKADKAARKHGPTTTTTTTTNPTTGTP
ncbi:MAG: hypothetical protein Q9163_004261 [Psora crenata]